MLGERFKSPLAPFTKNLRFKNTTGSARMNWVSPIPAGFFMGSSPGNVTPIIGPIASPNKIRQKTTERQSRSFNAAASASAAFCASFFAVAVFFAPAVFSDGRAPYPAFATASDTAAVTLAASAESAKRQTNVFFKRFTAASVTPSVPRAAFSTRAEHAAQLMPVTSNRSSFMVKNSLMVYGAL